MQNRCSLSHLDHESRSTTREVVRCPHARPNAIEQRQARSLRRYKAAHLREQTDDRGLSQHCALAAHVWSSDDQKSISGIVEINAIGYKSRFAEYFNHGMAALHDFNFIAVVHLRTRETAPRRSFSERAKCIDDGKGACCGLNAFCSRGNLPADAIEKFRFKKNDPLFSSENLLFPIAQFRSGKSFCIR